MKTINVTFTDSEHKKLKKIKGNMDWRSAIVLTFDKLKGGLENGKNNYKRN